MCIALFSYPVVTLRSLPLTFPLVFVIVPVRECIQYMCTQTVPLHKTSVFPFTLFSSCEVFQVILPVGKEAASGREDRAGLGLAQGENEATDACVRTR